MHLPQKHQVTKKAQKSFFSTSFLVKFGGFVIWWHFLFWIFRKAVNYGNTTIFNSYNLLALYSYFINSNPKISTELFTSVWTMAL